MNQKKTWLYIAFAVVLAIIVIGCNILRRNSPVRKIKVVVDYAGCDTLVSSQSLHDLVVEKMPTLGSQQVKNVNCKKVSETICSNVYVEHCETSVSIGRDIVIHATQRTPIIRLFATKDVSVEQKPAIDSLGIKAQTITRTASHECYLDKEGCYMPLSNEGSADVLVGNGYIKQHLPIRCDSVNFKAMAEQDSTKGQPLAQIWALAMFLHKHQEYGPLFDQLYMDEKGDLCLAPKVGNHIVIVGDADNLEKKFSDLLVFYHKAMNQVGWNTYKQINLKYKKQIICTQR